MGLEEILKGIDEKVNEEVNKIRKEAEEEKRKIIERANKQAQERKKQIIEEGKRQVDEEMRRKLVEVRREERKNILTFKAEMMRQVFAQAKKKFLQIDEKEYLSLMRDVLVASIRRGDEEILISPGDKDLVNKDFIKEIEKAISEKGIKPALKFSFELDEEDRGFIVKSEDVQINATISTLFLMVNDREEIEVARRLFG
ncbi:hypothetical protein IBX65_02365 [Candidatus Aerophobetes bacterium]|nr:hypothetical protein [Candidatus Aerophobetes bacterium]